MFHLLGLHVGLQTPDYSLITDPLVYFTLSQSAGQTSILKVGQSRVCFPRPLCEGGDLNLNTAESSTRNPQSGSLTHYGLMSQQCLQHILTRN